MAREKLFPDRPESDRRSPHNRFRDLASQVLQVPKAVVDERERKWREQNAARRAAKPPPKRKSG